jgi:hypothetical protein
MSVVLEATTADVPARSRSGPARWFFVGYALWCLALALAGFGESYAAANAGEFEISPTGHIHGVIMMAWLGLFFWQALLAARGEVEQHRKLGPYIAIYALVIWLSLWAATASSLIRFDESVMTFLYDVLIVQFMLITLFPSLFLWALIARRRSAAHRRLMALATAVLVQAGIDRIGWLPTFDLPGFWSNSLAFLVLMGAPIVVFDLATLRRVHGATLSSLTLIAVVHIGGNVLWGSPAWRSIATLITELVT